MFTPVSESFASVSICQAGLVIMREAAFFCFSQRGKDRNGARLRRDRVTITMDRSHWQSVGGQPSRMTAGT